MHLVPRDKDFIANCSANDAGNVSDVASLGKSDSGYHQKNQSIIS